MYRDELRQPLRRRSLGQRLWERRPSLLVMAYALAGTALAAGATWAVRQPAGPAGEPIVVVSIPPAETIAAIETAEAAQAEAEPTAGPETPPGDDPDTLATASTEPAEQPDFSSGEAQPEEDLRLAPQQEAVVTTSARRPLVPVQERLLESTSWGKLPKVADGQKPSRVYERTVSLNVIHSDQPKIALLLGGMGLNKGLTQKAIKDLPPDVSLAFAPYGEDLQSQVNKARAEGHEVYLQVPLEPVGYPASNPGPKTLTGDGAEAENLDALRWHMGRFQGYAGIVNYMGGRFLAMPKAIKPMLNEIKTRGLLFLEDGSLALSASETAGKAVNAPVRRAKIVIDTDPSPQAITAALTLLEEHATGTGFAIGTGSGLEVTIETVRDWAKAAEERGIILVPISAAYKGRTG